mmetsp:Transcript_70376/g.113472  ORF Transcript_70376/g.113472 Transcript_70376/m.113472 type:complete len:210 (+) Transcript_70376:57-686(+)
MTVTVMVSDIPAIGWLKSKVASVSPIFVTMAFIGPLSLCIPSSAPTSTSSGSLSKANEITISSSRSPKTPPIGSTFFSPTFMPSTPLSSAGMTCAPPTTKSKGPLPSDESMTLPSESRTISKSISTWPPCRTPSPPSAPAEACRRTRGDACPRRARAVPERAGGTGAGSKKPGDPPKRSPRPAKSTTTAVRVLWRPTMAAGMLVCCCCC